MSTNKCKTKPCGCEDKGLTTQTPCSQNTPDCPDPEQCAETFSGECIVYTGDTIVDADIQYGDRFNEIVQKLTLMILNPGCMTVGATCQSALGVMSIAITTTTASIKWDAVPFATSYVVEYKKPTDLAWLAMPAVFPTPYPSQAIGGLTPNTDYWVRVRTVCPLGSCYSLTILIRTKLI